MLKKSIGALAVLAVLAFSAVAFAEVKDFGDFTVDVPDDWAAAQNGTTVAITANDKSAAISVTVESTGGTPLKDLAAAFSQQLKGSEPALDDDVYRFTFTNPNGVESNAFLTENEDGKKYCLIVVTGENPALGGILDSITDK